MATVENVIHTHESALYEFLSIRFILTLLFARCGGTIGIYYCIKRCAVLYLNSGNGTFTPSPYLDAHGEVDLSMRYGILFTFVILILSIGAQQAWTSSIPPPCTMGSYPQDLALTWYSQHGREEVGEYTGFWRMGNAVTWIVIPSFYFSSFPARSRLP